MILTAASVMISGAQAGHAPCAISIGLRCYRAGSRFARGGRGKPPAYALHDPCVIVYLLAPELFDGVEANVAVETQSPLTLGMTVVDWRGISGRPANARVMTTIDADGFYALLTERLAALP